MHARSLAIVVPAYNEAKRIGPALDELFEYLDLASSNGDAHEPGAAALPPRIDVLVVDDGSTDGTAAIVRARPEAQPSDDRPPRLGVMTVPHGGKGAAVQAGMLAANADLLIFTDSDMATPPDEIPRLVAALARADVALGSRIQPDGTDMRKSQPGYRRALGKVFHALASAWVAGPVQDTQCGFKGFTREAAHDLFSRQRIRSIVFDVELIFLARRRGYRMEIVPIRWSDVHGSRMRPRFGLALQVAWDLLRIRLLHRKVGRRQSVSSARHEPPHPDQSA
jgi:dolichyl-phosphate beta-glucosyltransferase